MDLTNVLKDCKPGEWVVLDQTRTKVLGRADDPETALRQLHRDVPMAVVPDCLLLMVPDPHDD